VRRRYVTSALVVLGMLAMAGCTQQPVSRVADNRVLPPASPALPSPSVTPTWTPPPVPSTTASAPTARPAAPASPRKTPAVTGALAFTGRTVGGRTFNGASLAGKPTVLWFWTPWCPLCHGQVPDVQDASRRFGAKVNVVGVGGLDGADPIRTFVSEQHIDMFPNVSDTSGAVWKHFEVTQQGTYVLIDAKGKIQHRGYLDGDSLRDRLAKMSG
jgi:peroxiredoxin